MPRCQCLNTKSVCNQLLLSLNLSIPIHFQNLLHMALRCFIQCRAISQLNGPCLAPVVGLEGKEACNWYMSGIATFILQQFFFKRSSWKKVHKILLCVSLLIQRKMANDKDIKIIVPLTFLFLSGYVGNARDTNSNGLWKISYQRYHTTTPSDQLLAQWVKIKYLL